MNEMGTKFAKRKKSVRIGAITLLLAVLLACVSVVSVFAAANTFVLNYPEDAVVNTTNHTVDWSQFFSTTDNVNLGGNGVFTLKDSGISGLKGIKIGITNVNTDVNVTVDKQAFRGLSSSTSGGSTYIYYNNRSGITASDVRNIFDAITISFKTSKSNGSTKVTVRGSSTNSMGAGSAANGYRLGNIYTCEMHFYNFAQSTIDMDTLRIGYESESPDMSMVSPADKNMGKASFDVNISAGDVGLTSKLQQVQVGYAIKKATEAWNTTNETLQGAKTLEAADLTDPQTIEVTGFDANTDYDVKVITITEGKTDSPKETASIRVRYDTPMVNTFNVGDTDAAHIGGNRMNIQATVAFNNTNYDNKTWIGQDDAEYTGAALKLEVFFTDNLQQEDGVDASTWTPALSGEYSLSGERRSATLSDSYLLPEKDSPNCAYRLVATDLISGYKMYTYSKPFIVDSTAPTKPVVSAENLEGSLEDGTALVGGENANIELAIGDSVDAASGVKEYAYSMYYVSSDDGDEFAMENDSSVTADNITSQKILQVLKAAPKKAGFSDSRVEITDWTTLAKEENANTTSLSLSKDGYYCVMARATDKVGKNSEEAVALFRVDLTVPNAPVARMASPKAGQTVTVTSGSNGTSVNTSALEAYDGRTYTNKDVWVFLNTPAQTGKTTNTKSYQYSMDGGLQWFSVKDDANFVSLGGTVSQLYNPLNYAESKADFAYDVAFKLPDAGTSGYQTVIFKVADTLGNVSQPSEKIERRQTQILRPVGTLSHTNIEVALAVGNSSMSVTSLNEELSVAVAKKINQNYYGVPAHPEVKDPTNANFSPINLLYEQVSGKWVYHECTYDTNGNCTKANCPFENDAYDSYGFFTPEMVTLQGIEATNPGTDKNFKWVRYDHTNYKDYATVSLDTRKNYTETVNTGTADAPVMTNGTAKVIHTNLEPDRTSAAFGTKGTATPNQTRYTASGDRVVYTGQLTQYDTMAQFKANAVDHPSEGDTANQALLGKYAYKWGNYSNVHKWSIWNDTNGKNKYEDTITSMGKFVERAASDGYKNTAGSYGVARRIYHMIDMSNSRQETNTYNPDAGAKTYTVGNISDPTKLDMSTIWAMGYVYGAQRDWLFLYNDQAAKKEISFTVNDSMVYPHSNDGYGFLFNTTIRQNIAGDWVLSGYLFGLGNPSSSEIVSAYKWYILKLTDVNLDWFASGNLSYSGVYETLRPRIANPLDDLFGKMITSNNNTWESGNQKIEVVAYRDPDTTSTSVRNFRLVTDAESTILYLYNSGKNNISVDALEAQFQADSKKLTSNANFTEGYRAVSWLGRDKTTNLGTTLTTERPTVDGYQVGNIKALLTKGMTEDDDPADFPHSDSNCYGFGPLTSAKSVGHGCLRDSLVVFSNISMTMNRTRSLSEVVKEPKWGGGKARYILNISDASMSDYTDPILSADIQNCIITDKTRLITWGSFVNRKSTEAFIKTINGNGVFQATDLAAEHDEQIDNIADYIAKTYYSEYGIDVTKGDITSQVNAQANKKGTVYSLEDAKKMTFKVETFRDEEGNLVDYNTSTANEDFPAGRWYVVHDTTGYPTAAKNPLNGKWSDGLNLQITNPGRFSVYFAPDQKLVDAGLLNPKDNSCVFDFIVNQPPVAQFTANMVSGKISINDLSYDPDNDKKPSDTQDTGPSISGGQTQITGIVTTRWHWNMTAKYTDPTTTANSVVTVATGTYSGSSKNPYNGLTIEQLTKGISGDTVNVDSAVVDKLATVEGNKYPKPPKYNNKYYYTSVPTDATITFYETVEDVSMRKVLNSAGTGYVYENPISGKNAASNEARQNLVDGSLNITVSPRGNITLEPVGLYDTAESSKTIIVSRASTQPQDKNFDLSWQMDIDGTTYDLHGNSATGSTVGNFDNWYLPADAKVNGTSWTKPVFTVYTDSSGTTYHPTCVNGTASGKWTMTQEFIKWATAGKNNGQVSIRIVESLTGIPLTSTDNTPTLIKGPAGRTVYFYRDQIAPSSAHVNMNTQVKNSTGAWGADQEYDASGYLDVSTNNRRIHVHVDGSEDSEGKVMGYGYYFYEYASDGSTVAKIFTLNAQGKLVEVTTGSTINDKIKNAIGWNASTQTGKSVLPASGGDIYITAAAMRKQPTDILNLAIFAFDNQKGITGTAANPNFTGANESTRTRLENIRLASFTPMPTEITAVNSLGEKIAYIDNVGGFKDASGNIPGDTAMEPIRANSSVTVSFTPRQGWFDVSNPQAPVYLPTYDGAADATHAKYYMDVSKEADLTNKAQIEYVIYKGELDVSGKNIVYKPLPDYQGAGGVEKPLTIEATKQVTVTDSGYYKVTARVKNGSNAYSAERTITFEIDKSAPVFADTNVVLWEESTNTAYQENSWGRQVSITISGATDDNQATAYYVYSTDNGAHETIGEKGLKDVRLELNKSGEYILRVYAIDQAGNRSATVTKSIKIDRDGPVMHAPSLTAKSETTMMYSDYVISIVDALGGKVQAWNDGTADEQNREISVKLNASQQFLITPEDGYTVQSITCGGKNYSWNDLPDQGSGKLLTIENVASNAELNVVFAESGTISQSYMYNARMVSSNIMKARAAASNAAEISSVSRSAEIQADEATMYTVVNQTSVSNGTELLIADGNQDSSMIQVAAGGSVDVLITPKEGYTVESAVIRRIIGGTTQEEAAVLSAGDIAGTFKFTVSNIQSTVGIEVIYKEQYTHKLTIWASDHGTVTPKSGVLTSEGGYSFYQDGTVVLQMTAEEKYMLSAIRVNGVEMENVTGNEFTIPVEYTQDDVEVTVEFTADTANEENHYLVVKYNDNYGRVNPLGEVGETDDAGITSHKVMVADNDGWIFHVYPNPGYTAIVTKDYYSDIDGAVTGEAVELTKHADGGWVCSVDDITNNSNKLNINFVNTLWDVTYGTQSVKSNGEVSMEDGGTVTVSRSDGGSTNESPLRVPEGTNVTFQIEPKEGWRISSVKVNDIEMGTRKSYTLEKVAQTHDVQVTFEERAFTTAASSHSITALATLISDKEQSLHRTETYRFRLSDGVTEQWSDWQLSASYTFTNLQPNKKYRVTVQAQDISGNRSEPSAITAALSTTNDSSEIYTEANMPLAKSLSVADDENTVEKTVIMDVDNCGNPEDTEYKVYISRYRTMTSREEATLAGQNEDHWATLSPTGQLLVQKLNAGTHYYMQVIARNHKSDEEHPEVETTVNSKNIVDITLSPSSPPENTFFFEEQEKPGDPITLRWEKPEGEVQGYEIYRDGTLLERVSGETTTYVDDGIMGDTISQYSYAFVNSAGVGSRRTAVSEEYYLAAKGNANVKGAEEALIQPDPTKLAALDKLKTDLNADDVYNETMTYPLYPSSATRLSASPLYEDDEHSGRAEVLISGTMGSVARAQKYQVGLQAYTVQENEEGQKVYTPVNGWNWQDHMVWTKSADNRGAIATWENLDINLEYRVVVNEVRSTGPRKREGSIIVDGYAGSTAGIEGSYGKDCRVNAEGYYYTFTDDQAKAILNNSETVTPWAAGEADAYVQRGVGAGNTWGQPMGEYIQFNKSPHVALSDDPFDGNENAEFATVNGQKALVLHEGGNMKFTVKVKVWDVDGAYDQNSKYAITASMNGRSGLLTAAADKDGTAIDVKNILTVAQKEADSGIYTLTFDASQFSTTGIYGYTGTDARALSLSVSDGGSKATVTVDLPVIVNKSAPQIITENIKGVKSIENNRTYGTEAESVIKLTTAVENGSMDADTMRIIRLAVMSSQYDELFGVHTVDQIMEKLNNNDMKAVNSARKLLGNDTYSEYEKGGFNETETKTLVDKVTPSIVSYFEITEEQYNTHKETAPDKVMKDENGYYWAEKEYAFANGLCQFLERGADKRITVKVPEDKIGSVYSAMLTSTFGKNVTTLPISFRVVKAPSLTVRSDKKWVWVENVPKDEFKAYQSQNKTVGDVAEEFKDSYGTKPWEQEPDDPDFAEGTPAYKPADATGDEPEGTKYSVFRLKDSGVQIGTNWATLTLDIETGVYSKLNQVTAVLKTNTEPPTDAEVAAGVPCGELTKGIKGIKLSNLQPGTTYFVWFCYKVEDPDTGEVKDCRVDHYTAVTLINDYGAAYYSFNENTMDVREKDAPTNGDFQRLEFVISRNYSETGRNSYANLIPSEIKYYVADQDGYPLDQEGNQLPKNAPEDQMVELTGDKLEAAKNTLRLADNQEKFVFGANTDSQILRLWLYNTGEEQGHMLARVHLTIDPESQNGYNYIGDANGYMTVFVQDDESAVTVYIGELDREASSELNTFEYEYNPDDNTGLSKNCYEYSFQDLQNGYSSGEVGMLNLALKNTVGSSTLTGIEARIYKDNNGKPSTEPSTDFVITKAPNPNQLDPVVNEVTGTIRSRTAVSPSSSLEDGIYSAWLKLSWEGVERENVIWVRLHQVVGQSTLKGYIYLTSDKPAEASTAFIGRSNVTVTAIDNSFTRTVTTNEFGYYEMPNILNGKKYTIKVERPGFVTYNSTEFGSSGTWTLGSVSKEYELSFQLIGGDLDGNGSVRAEDYNLFSDYYSKTYDQTVETEENLELRKRDYNADGVVNALDRMVLWGNLNKSARNYRTDEGGSREYFMPKEIQP